VECQLSSIKKCFTVPAIRKALRELPSTLDKTYERIIDNIPVENRNAAHCAMQFLAISFRPLTIDEVAEAVAVDCENETFDPEQRLRDRYDILEICSSLVTLFGCVVD
jgi:hypothetical protein